MHKKSPFQIIFIHLIKEIVAHIWIKIMRFRCLLRILHLKKERTIPVNSHFATIFKLDFRCFPVHSPFLSLSFFHNLWININIILSEIPVSYTHLDVYKRQALTLNIPENVFIYVLPRTALTVTYLFLITSGSSSSGTGIPVSYTHLDVYKRQP